MKILLINKFFYLSGGAERYVQLWMRLLRERGHEVIPFAMDDPRNWPTPYARWFAPPVYFDAASLPACRVAKRKKGSVPQSRDGKRPRGPAFAGLLTPFSDTARLRCINRVGAAVRSIYSLAARRSIISLLRHAKPDIAHVNSYCYQLTGSILPPLREAGIRVVQTAHEYKHICPNQHLYNQRRDEICEACRGRWYPPLLTRCVKGSFGASVTACLESLVDRLLGLSRRNIDLAAAPSEFMRRKMVEFGWPAARIVHVPNFVFAGDFDPSGKPGDYFLFVGRLVKHKGILTLVRAMRRLRGARLVIAGDGPLRGEVARLAGEVADRVKLAGFLDGASLRELLERCLAVVVPSEWYENCPYAVLEAMAAGRAVVASQIGGTPELVNQGVNGLLFPPGDEAALVEKLDFLWQHKEQAALMGANGRRLVEARHAPEAHYERMIHLFKCP